MNYRLLSACPVDGKSPVDTVHLKKARETEKDFHLNAIQWSVGVTFSKKRTVREDL